MSVLIKGMKMPKDCIKCPFCLLADGHWKCLADGSFADFGGTCRPPKCPLIEVPTPHGRLIDDDALYKTYQEICSDIACISCPFLTEDGCKVEQMIMYAPTIIEAEEGADHE